MNRIYDRAAVLFRMSAFLCRSDLLRLDTKGSISTHNSSISVKCWLILTRDLSHTL